MTLTIQHDNGNTYIWRSGDDKADLRRAILLLQTALDESETPVATAASAQATIPTGA